jgi:hypothetical protein
VINLTDILQHHGIDYKTEGHRHSRTGWVQVDCPYCGKGSKKFHMGYNIRSGYFNCWVCGSHQNVATLADILGIPYGESKKLLETTISHKTPLKDPVRGRLVLPRGIHTLGPKHVKYLRLRGFNPQQIVDTWKVQGISFNLHLPWRIFIPIHYQGEIVSWTTRSIMDDTKSRYVSASGKQEIMDHKSLLYGEDFCRHSVCCVEGPFDAWAIGPGAVATFGTSYTRSQVLKLSKYPIRAVCFDSTKEAQKQARKLIDLLSVYRGKTFNIQLDSGDDPADAHPKEINQIRKLLQI